ncbi:D-lactaldehyde dehydrogenase [Pholiota conissans]|uniref:D-lactaldehyde dehydrogenase n=1 Tax=Pholiota conissans TaxID=109636 RepID=A0A9P5Z9Z0_9AGAR|nr:D-lactaldehyde dehydrogenase [Pholiota conissans]
MPTINKGDKVLVSGANGYIAMWIVRTLLERGYSVRGTVRNEVKAEFMKAYFSGLGFGDNFETVVVDDIEKEGAFDEAVKGVDAIEHTASPFHPRAKTADEFIQPAVRGTLGMLASALKNGSQLKRVVVTSSCAAVMMPPPSPKVFTEKDWNLEAPKAIEEQGDKAPPMTIYRASKTLAERSAWDFVEKHKSEIKWDLSVINPPFVFGPPIHDVNSISSLNTSVQLWIDMVTSTTPKSAQALLDSNAWVDVRDVALAHVLALEVDAAGGERVVVAEGSWIWQEWLDIANSLPSNPFSTHPLYKGEPDLLKDEKKYLISYDTCKEHSIFGIKFHTKLETTKDTLEDFAKRGW